MMDLAGNIPAATVLALLLVYCRVQACLIAMPVFAERLLPVRLKVGLAAVLTPLFLPDGSVPEGLTGAEPLRLALFAAAEVVTGLVLGIMVRLAALALDIAASTIATTASLSQIMGVTNEFAPHPIGNLLHLAGAALLMAMGFPLLVCDILGDSFTLRDLGAWPDSAVLLPALVGIVLKSFALAMVLAAPFILGGLLFQALSGVISKVMPALPIVFIGAPAAILLALVALCLLVPAILSVWSEHLMTFMLPGL